MVTSNYPPREGEKDTHTYSSDLHLLIKRVVCCCCDDALLCARTGIGHKKFDRGSSGDMVHVPIVCVCLFLHK